MAGFKKSWKISEMHAGMRYVHRYNEEGTKSIGGGYVVTLFAALDRERGRDVFADLTPDEADELADRLREYAARVREENESL
jgi:hypothetical protein